MKISILRQTYEGDYANNRVDFGDADIRTTHAPDNDASLVNKAYVDSVASGLDSKESCAVATTGNVDLATGGLLVIDGITVEDGDRVLVKSQTDPTENGIYIAAAGAWVRSDDMDGTPAEEVSAGNYTFVEQGSTQASTGWVLTGDGLITIGTDDLIWTQFSQASDYIAGEGIDITGNTISVDVTDLVGSGLEDDGSNNIRIATSAAGAGITGGGGAALSVESDVVGGANLAKAISVSVNGVAVKIDDVTIGENGSGQLEVKDASISGAKLDTVNGVGAGVDGFALAWNQTSGKMEWTAVGDLVDLPGSQHEEALYGASNDIVSGTPFGLAQPVANNAQVLVFWNGLLLKQSEYSINVSGDPDTLTLNDTVDNDFIDGDTISVYYLYQTA